jgi:hypothetical protein
MALDAAERSASRFCRFTTGKRAGARCLGGWVGARVGLQDVILKIAVNSCINVWYISLFSQF